MRHLAFLAVPLLAACSVPGYAPEDYARQFMSNHLNDSESARLRNVTKAGIGFCGEVNARNNFGAYTGFQRFYVTEFALSTEGEDADEVAANCSGSRS